ncbi:hypothetical protein RJ45_13335 [Photobacterium gaetbulicola]|uniref:4Fe-4S ferredoxin-type domain-containing protein n=1 Tax=Photobacterium gaetbulicola TaxID=1295392 RepID=A0A0B9GF32_9GAMM|nr:electron transfer flavoprotein subunit alpha/FixB family protein [Photobacterium gaetbulicola]KHT63365.1 hypothetical protein RJ45_13335 [Photobacterium gaetbulicola]
MLGIIVDNKGCDGCCDCLNSCPYGSISITDGYAQIDNTCQLCRKCLPACPKQLIQIPQRATDEGLDEWRGIVVYLQLLPEGISIDSLLLLQQAHLLAEVRREPVFAVAIGTELSRYRQQLASLPVKSVLCYSDPIFRDFDGRNYAKALLDACEHLKPNVVILPSGLETRAVAPWVATKMKTGLTADCTELKLRRNGDLVQIRPAFGGTVMARITTPFTRPQFATVQAPPSEVPAVNMPRTAPLIERKLSLTPIDVVTSSLLSVQPARQRFIIAGGGLKQVQDLHDLQVLADKWQAELLGTRVLIDRGWLPSHKQVGLSGRRIHGSKVLCVGVSGSIQFQAGLGKVDHLTVINNDEHAPLLQRADLAICSDLYKVVEQIHHLVT